MLKISAIAGALCAIGLAGCGAPNTGLDTLSKPFIVNGQPPPADQNDERVFSTVALTDPLNAREGHSWCTATLIAPRVLVTAGHCVGGTAWAAFERNVTEKNLIRVVKQVRHPKFVQKNLVNDIAIYILEKDAPSTHKPAKIYAGELPIGQPVVVAGYGVTAYRGKNDTGVLRQANVFVKSVSSKPTSEFVLAGKNGEDTCQGDSGGPAYVKVNDHFEVVGATSWGDDCGIEGHYTDLRAHAEFINDTLAKHGG